MPRLNVLSVLLIIGCSKSNHVTDEQLLLLNKERIKHLYQYYSMVIQEYEIPTPELLEMSSSELFKYINSSIPDKEAEYFFNKQNDVYNNEIIVIFDSNGLAKFISCGPDLVLHTDDDISFPE